MNPKVSVIVPAYNAEKFLARCLNSIAVQTMPDFECIIVDDGSIDKTGLVADSFAKRDTRFRVIHQKNAGVAMARQAGIDAATGVYTIQFDADDWVEENILEELVNKADENDADLVICDINVITPTEDIIWVQRPESLRPEVVFGQMMQQLYGSLCNKLIRKDCYQKYNVRFIPGMNLAEDQYVCLCILSHSIIIGYVPKALYHYDRTQNAKSLVNTGMPPADRLRPLELIAESIDVTDVQAYFDDAILFIAYEALSFSKEKCTNYTNLFKKHLPSIRRATGFPFRVKLLVLLRIYGVRIPIGLIKKLLGK